MGNFFSGVANAKRSFACTENAVQNPLITMVKDRLVAIHGIVWITCLLCGLVSP